MLNVLKNNLAKELFGMTAVEAQEKLICVACKNPAVLSTYNELARKEYKLSGLCSACQDQVFKEMDKL